MAEIQRELTALAEATGLRGLVLPGREGVNATVSGEESAIATCKTTVARWFDAPLHFKDSTASKHPFQFFRIKERPEIVTLGQPEIEPPSAKNHHLAPKEWRADLARPETIVLDTRNDYEIALGKFRGAVDLGLKEFSEFPAKLAARGLPKDQPIRMYCTGGIRCEKALVLMRREGYRDVAQLEGGILNYMREFPDSEFDGECFVFDYRVAVDQNLAPTRKYRLCPHCGQPAAETLSCIQCGREEYVCANCRASGERTCSKNCAHHARIGSGSRKCQRN